ncbi:MAG: TerC/Alx family metal homeostasis membrane protein [Methanomassiliicoccaceae archaeon]|nr:TerC/Alx family metal homeostasis membrane protein [Methanomassiliicoccaceae archaeon]MCL2148972.1 TerC/Alx family metal homeostasis membrane protein [Methanomassiliicoccaceae archaeon]
MIDSTAMWAVFFAVIIAMFAIDLGVLNRGARHMSVKRALGMTALWVGLALSFGVLIYFEMGADSAAKYITAYVIEEMLSVDNLFVFIVIFGYFCVPDAYQHKALFYGVVGAFVFRALFIFAGAELLEMFDWMMYIFGAVLIITAIKTVMKKDEGKDSRIAARLSRRFNMCTGFHGDRLFTVVDGVRMVTPLFVCIIVIELTDIMFAFDSVPAALAITTDKFIVYTSNLFAVVGLRSLFFVIKGSMERLEYLKYGLGVILAFIGVKMLASDYFHVDVVASLAFILAVLAATVAVSLYARRRARAPAA